MLNYVAESLVISLSQLKILSQKLMRSTLHLLAKEVYDDKWGFSQHNDGALILAISPDVKKQIILKTPKGISPTVKVKTPKVKVKIKLRF